MTTEDDKQRAARLARARAFLEAGRTQIDPAPQPAPQTAPPAAPAGAAASGAADAAAKDPEQPAPADPTRFGDWEKNGRCIDF